MIILRNDITKMSMECGSPIRGLDSADRYLSHQMEI